MEKMIQLEGLPREWKEKFESMQIPLSSEKICSLKIPSQNGFLIFRPTGKFAEPDIEIWSSSQEKANI